MIFNIKRIDDEVYFMNLYRKLVMYNNYKFRVYLDHGS